jgi:O-antigen ligase
MAARRPQIRSAASIQSGLLAAGITIAAGAVALVGARRFGLEGVAAPLALVVGVMLLARPVAAVAFVGALTVLLEGPASDAPGQRLYEQVFASLTPLDLLIALTAMAVLLDAARKRRSLRLPPALALPFGIALLAMAAGVVTATGAGVGPRDALLALRIPFLVLLMATLVVNLGLDREQATKLVLGLLALAIVKAILGVLMVASGGGTQIEGETTMTYYEPTANWLVLVALLGVIAALLGRTRAPAWVLLGLPLLIASLVLSYRRSFWIAAVLGFVLVLLLASTPSGRRMLLPVGLLIAASVWVLGSVGFQAQTPLTRRVESLAPSRLQANKEDRYRLDERANVLAELRDHPISGLGVEVPWRASEQALPLEHEAGRDYVHFAALWWWLKLGILGLAAYVGLLLSALLLAWRSWRRNETPVPRWFGLASFAAVIGLAVMETTASFTGVDTRFSVLFGLQLGLLALFAQPLRGRGERPATG